MPERSSALIRYLDPDAVARIAAIGFKPAARVEGNLVGNHRSPFHGFAIEFAGHRQYVPGDDLKHIDWKVYYKSGRYMIKQYELETNLVAHLVIDISETMKFDYESGRKLDYAAFAAVGLANAIVDAGDQVSATLFADSIVDVLPPSGSHDAIINLSRTMEAAGFKDRTAIGRVLSLLAEQIGRRKVVFVISDFFGDVAATFDGVKRLLHGKNEVILLHLVDPIEMDFNHPGRLELVELEGTRRLMVEGRNVRDGFNRLFRAYLDDMRESSRKLDVDYVLCNTGDNFGVTLAKYLNTRLAVAGTGGRR